MEDALGEYLCTDEPGDVEGTAAVLEYLDLCREHFDPARELDCPPWFEDAVWPCFVESICDGSRAYYLSADELMLVCELRQQNIAVFGKQRRQARFLGAVTGHAGSPLVLVVLHLGDGQGRVRSHFQRLVRVADVRQAEKQQRRAVAEVREQQRERAAMANADLEAEAWRAAAACEMEEAGTPAGELESQEPAEASRCGAEAAPFYGMEAIMAGAAYTEG